MTTPRISSFVSVAVGAPSASDVRVSQFASVTVLQQAPPSIHISQLTAIMVVANNKKFLSLGPVFGLGCWSPCATLAHRFGFVPTTKDNSNVAE